MGPALARRGCTRISISLATVMLLVASLLVASAQATEPGGYLVTEVTSDHPTSGGSLELDDIGSFDPDGGTAVIDSGGDSEETISYEKVDADNRLLTNISRPQPKSHAAGTFVSLSQATPSPTPEPANSPSSEPTPSPYPEDANPSPADGSPSPTEEDQSLTTAPASNDGSTSLDGAGSTDNATASNQEPFEPYFLSQEIFVGKFYSSAGVQPYNCSSFGGTSFSANKFEGALNLADPAGTTTTVFSGALSWNAPATNASVCQQVLFINTATLTLGSLTCTWNNTYNSYFAPSDIPPKLSLAPGTTPNCTNGSDSFRGFLIAVHDTPSGREGVMTLLDIDRCPSYVTVGCSTSITPRCDVTDVWCQYYGTAVAVGVDDFWIDGPDPGCGYMGFYARSAAGTPVSGNPPYYVTATTMPSLSLPQSYVGRMDNNARGVVYYCPPSGLMIEPIEVTFTITVGAATWTAVRTWDPDGTTACDLDPDCNLTPDTSPDCEGVPPGDCRAVDQSAPPGCYISPAAEAVPDAALYADCASPLATGSSADEILPLDTLYSIDENGLITVTNYPVGTLDGGGSSGSPSTQSLTKIDTDCYEIDRIETYGYHCLHRFRPSGSDGDPNFNYRVFWWTGSSNARGSDNENRLMRVVDQFWCPDEAECGFQITEWSPNGTVHPSPSCETTTRTLSLSYNGVGASSSSSFQTCSELFGPSWYGPDHFSFHWKGEKEKAVTIGMGGGFEVKFRPEVGYFYNANFRNRTCTPAWACSSS